MVIILFKVGIIHPDFSKKTYPIEYLTHKVGYLRHYKDSPHLPYEVKRKKVGILQLILPHLMQILLNRIGVL